MQALDGPQTSQIVAVDDDALSLYSPPPDLRLFAVQGAPQGVFYIPNFIDARVEENLLQKVQSAPKTKWTQLRNRRLQSWGGSVQSKGMIQEPLPSWILDQCRAVQKIAGLASLPNHCLINEYLPGQGIMSHVDGPLYFPVVANLSLGSHTIMNLHKCRHDGEDAPVEAPVRLLLEPRSLLLLSSHAYLGWMHGIDEVAQDTVDSSVANLHLTSLSITANQSSPPAATFSLARGTRVSLTIRYVPKVIKNPLKLSA